MTENVLIRRTDAAQSTIHAFLDEPFQWGTNDCAHLCDFAVQQFLGTSVIEQIGLRDYATKIGAKRALTKAGFKTIEAVLDAHFERIAPAATLPCDIVGIEGEGGWTALGLAIGDGRFLCFYDGQCRWAAASALTIVNDAWRVA